MNRAQRRQAGTEGVKISRLKASPEQIVIGCVGAQRLPEGRIVGGGCDATIIVPYGAFADAHSFANGITGSGWFLGVSSSSGQTGLIHSLLCDSCAKLALGGPGVPEKWLVSGSTQNVTEE